jgi:hypothetical protein
MGSKARKREMRQAAARARDNRMFDEGTRHAQSLRDLSRLSRERFAAVQQHALADAQRPMSPNRNQALVVLGAMATIMRDSQRDHAGAGPSINEVRAAMGKEPLIDGHLTVAEYAEKNRLILNEGQAELLVSEACP